ncbi:MAG: DUF4961 domain-containing protein [Rikenellaceae bacterium]|jgi:hypothetical protein|nr:DUF4961 domain-containing protein [Rikenellaceae bacterium]
MKLLKNYKFLLAILVLPFIVATCYTIEEITQPASATPNSPIGVTVRIRLDAETDSPSKLIFGILVPANWNSSQIASMSVTTTGANYPANIVTNEAMTPVGPTETDPAIGMLWSEAFQMKEGLLNNLRPMKWIVYKSSTTFAIHDHPESNPGDKTMTATVSINLTTGAQNVKFFMGYACCGSHEGFSGDRWGSPKGRASVITVTDGTGGLTDYTVPPPVSTVPQNFGWGDIFSVQFKELQSALRDAPKIYLLGTVTYDGGQTKTVNQTGAKTLMENLGEGSWQRYIYLKDFFDLPAGAVVEGLSVYFANEDKSITVQDTGGEFVIEEARE